MEDLIRRIFDPNAKPSLTSIMNFTAISSGLIVGFIGAFLDKSLVVDYCMFLVGGGLAAKVFQYGSTMIKGNKNE